VSLVSEGRTYPVEIEYLPKRVGSSGPPVWDLAAEAFSKYAVMAEGSVLIFMPGSYEIQRTIQALQHRRESKGYRLLPLHGELPARDQDAAVAPCDRPRVVVATNVAETSITIEGVRLVIDSGLARLPRYDPYRGINTLLIERISHSSAEQRAGRAGRTAAGRCVRLWSKAEHAERPVRDVPEVQRLDLAEVVLTLKSAGIEDLKRFRWLDPPSETALAQAEELLLDLGAVAATTEGTTEITPIGKRMLAFPVHPRYARLLIAAQEFGCVHEACLVAALSQGRDLLVRNPDPQAAAVRETVLGSDSQSDFEVWMRAWRYALENHFHLETLQKVGIHAVTARQVAPLLDQFLRIAGEQGLDTRSHTQTREPLFKCILAGFSDRVARRLDSSTLRCDLVHGRRGTLARESAARRSELLVAAEVAEIGGRSGEVTTILSLATPVEAEWLSELFPGDMKWELNVSLDAMTRRAQAEEVLCFRGLAVKRRRLDAVPAEAAARLFAEEVLAGRLQLSKWDHAVEQWILRLNLLAEWCPELGLPRLDQADRRLIAEQICLGAVSYKDIKDREVRPAVMSWLSSSQRLLLDKYVPERVALSNGRTPRVVYSANEPPHISLRIQELFGVIETPSLAMGRVPLRVHILAPSMRPVQVTQDLRNFWREHYPRIKQELQRKYPKHEWK
jgi:ATP-dependent helicase HrpB